MIQFSQPFEAALVKDGDALIGELPGPVKGSKTKRRRIPRAEWDSALAERVAAMADGDSVDVEIIHRSLSERVAHLAGIAPLAEIPKVPGREEALRGGGFVNPYTFVPAPPRDALEGTPYRDREPDSHAKHGDGQYSGTLTLTLTTVTPLLLPAPVLERSGDESAEFDARLGPDGLPMIHGASVKGALRSAFETVTASRFGVFFEHGDPLAYRATAGSALELTPARVCRPAGHPAYFQLCEGDTAWRLPETVQSAAWVPAYQRHGEPLRRLGALRHGALVDHHGKRVHARVVLYRYEKNNTRFKVWRATHLALGRPEIGEPPRRDAERSGHLTLVPGVEPRIVAGWLSASGYSIGSKHDERLFVETPDLRVPIEEEHERYWRAVLAAYEFAASYSDPNDTNRRRAGGSTVERSRHVGRFDSLRDLPHGTLVYVRYDGARVTEVHPVMIGRVPFDASPAELLPAKLRPAEHRRDLSPADRLFGWVPPKRRDDDRDAASGYRGRLAVRSVRCVTADWEPTSFPPNGIVLSPLSGPKPTQFRFYASPDRVSGMPIERKTPKTGGYHPGGGLRGRKTYRWREERPGYWDPPASADNDDQEREYLALKAHRDKPKQVVRYRRWVRPEVTFKVTLLLEGVDEADLGALLWLLARGDRGAAPLRLGAGKPYGFGVVSCQIDWDATRLWDAQGVRCGWLRLDRPAPVAAESLAGLADSFDKTAQGNEVLREVTESYLKAAHAAAEPVHYPRRSTVREAESFEWFVANDGIQGSKVTRGWALPHARDPEQRLPYVTPDADKPSQHLDRHNGKSGRSGDPKPPPGKAPIPRVPPNGGRSARSSGNGRSGNRRRT